jgi:hypothetical protein
MHRLLVFQGVPAGGSCGTDDHVAVRDESAAGPADEVVVVEVLDALDDADRQIDQARWLQSDRQRRETALRSDRQRCRHQPISVGPR